ncbi:MAG: hypothetical protein JW884_05275 [Deltaproteobacteria bacterium]|nr:hypothetical protein [Deltaproteobacteria bacterium]
MDFYEVFVKLVAHGREIGRICVRASSPFAAAAGADDAVDLSYGRDVIAHTLRVSRISEDEFLHRAAA